MTLSPGSGTEGPLHGGILSPTAGIFFDKDHLLDLVPAMIIVADDAGSVVSVNDHWLQAMGYRRDEVVGRPRARFIAARWHAYLDDVIRPQLEAGACVDGIEIEFLKADGSVRPVLLSTRIDLDPVTGRRHDIAVGTDLTMRRISERALRQSESLHRAIFEIASDACLITDSTGVVQSASPSAREMIGYEAPDIVGLSLFDLVHPDDVRAARTRFESLLQRDRDTDRGQLRARAKDGSWKIIDWAARNALSVDGIGGFVIACRDVTHAKRLDTQASSIHTIEAVSKVSGDIAHDINNVLGAILGFAKFLVEDLGADSPQRAYAERIVNASERGRELVHQVFTFSRAGRVERQQQDLVALVSDTCRALPALLPEAVAFSSALAPRPLAVSVNAGQIQQVLLNLVLNARDALGSKAGEIRLEVAEIAAGDAEHRRHLDHEGRGVHALDSGEFEVIAGTLVEARRFARVLIADSGSGMSSEALGKAFTPFFTTKSRASRCGLGLATVHNVVVSAGGSCVIRSVEGNGTSVAIWLPISDQMPATNQAASRATPIAVQRGVMVIDDERDFADATAIGLRRMGYDAVAFNDPLEALKRFNEHPDFWGSVISDERMPGMSGLQLLEEMKRLRPSVDFILCSGYTDGTIERAAFDRGASHFFLKPVDVGSFVRAIEDLGVSA